MTLSYYADVDKALAEWFKRVRRINVPVSGPLSAEKALYFAKQLGYKDFKASAGFLDRFKERQGITGQHICGEEKSVGQKCSGGKNSKERITVLVACNQDGTDKLPLLVIGKYAEPRSFRGSSMDLLLVIYKSQKNAWIDSVKFEEWVRKVDRKMRAANRQILLFIDNCTAHMSVAGLTNTRLIFFPPNCTSKLQPADQGIIQNLKPNGFAQRTMAALSAYLGRADYF
ncbi:tigger transposable element-derived protein 4-like [Orbicella faveolata]|uniref:tigger transposable element-derived protein 4-like n=1 Tax=Orbicella faveolata TaxID=48498 RepID=UPI0009E44A3C|nr:tigger transposable element-derived protein 4-like [Orbicella faveolata]